MARKDRMITFMLAALFRISRFWITEVAPKPPVREAAMGQGVVALGCEQRARHQLKPRRPIR
jgi:hypothetical protein